MGLKLKFCSRLTFSTCDMGDKKNIVLNIKEISNEYKIIAVFDTDKQIVKNPKFEKVGIVFKIEYQYSTW